MTTTPISGQSIWIPSEDMQQRWKNVPDIKKNKRTRHVNRVIDKFFLLLTFALSSKGSVHACLDEIDFALEKCHERITQGSIQQQRDTGQ